MASILLLPRAGERLDLIGDFYKVSCRYSCVMPSGGNVYCKQFWVKRRVLSDGDRFYVFFTLLLLSSGEIERCLELFFSAKEGDPLFLVLNSTGKSMYLRLILSKASTPSICLFSVVFSLAHALASSVSLVCSRLYFFKISSSEALA